MAEAWGLGVKPWTLLPPAPSSHVCDGAEKHMGQGSGSHDQESGFCGASAVCLVLH